MWEVDQSDLLREISAIKWTLICIAISLWGLTAYLFLKEFPAWWRSFDKKKNNLNKLPPEGSQGGHY